MELGVKFQVSTAGKATGVRFYKGATNTGTHVGNLWSAAGALLASVTFANETASGWQQALFATPVTPYPGDDSISSPTTPTWVSIRTMPTSLLPR